MPPSVSFALPLEVASFITCFLGPIVDVEEDFLGRFLDFKGYILSVGT